MLRVLTTVVAVMLSTATVQAACSGRNLLEDMPAAELQALRDRADAVPFAQGNLWQAQKGDQSMTLIGTYHFDDPRHGTMLERVAPLIAAAPNLLVEAGEAEERAILREMTERPASIMITEGPSLLQQLPPETWQQLSEAMRERQVPPMLAAKFQPWYAVITLALAPCMITDPGAKNGLDQQLVAMAKAQDIPVQALEPYDTLLKMFDGFTQDEMLEALQMTLAQDGLANDNLVTLADAYFDEDSRIIWELNRRLALDLSAQPAEQVERDLARMEVALMTGRNQAWIPVITAAAAKGPVVVAFGALHLSGEQGVLNLLAEEGWTLHRLALDAPPAP